MIKGSGGKGGDARPAQEAQNTLRSSSVVRVLELLSEGEIVGVVGGLKGVFLNDTPVMNDDGSMNFANVSYAERVGLPSQEYMEGFPSAEVEVAVGIEASALTPATKTVTSNMVDAVRVTVAFPAGLSQQDTTNGDLNGNSVTFAFDVKPSGSGTWTQAGQDMTVTGKTVSPYEKQFRLEKPLTTGTWDVRLRRVSPDDPNSASKSKIMFARMTEIRDVKLEYEDSAYVGVAVDAQSVGGQIPVRSYLVKGIKVQVPTNYDAIAHTYEGTWDGTFKYSWSNNPAWILYDILTNDRYGMGEFITPSMIDKFSFYDAGKYNDELVPNGKGGTEPRFTFNSVINARTDALVLVQNLAGAFRSTVIYSGGLISINQDRPTAVTKIVTKANVIGGRFEYKSSGLLDRHTVVNMTWNDREDRFLPKVSTVSDADGIARYGINLLETAAFGATTEGQAIRNAKWILDSEKNQTEIVTYKSALNQFDLRVGDVIKLFDEDYTNQVGAGRIKSATTTSITLDRPVTIAAGSTIDVQDPSGVGIINKVITNAAGTYTTVNVSTMASVPTAAADFIINSTVAARTFRIMNIKQEEPNIITVTALSYDPSKYARVELGISVPSPIFSGIGQKVIGDVTDVVITPSGKVTAEGITRGLLVSWVRPVIGVAVNYVVKWRRNKGSWTVVTDVESPHFELGAVDQGDYDFMIYAVNINGVQSSGTPATYSVDLSGGAGSMLLPVTQLQVVGGGTNFTGVDCNIEWTNPAANDNTLVTLKDFIVTVYDGATLLRTDYVEAVAPGAKAKYQYTLTMNKQDSTTPKRTFRIEVKARDTMNLTSTVNGVVFTNPAPAVLNGVTVLGAFQSVKVFFNKPVDSDLAGYMIWMSKTNGFALDATTLVSDGTNTFTSFTGLEVDTDYYVKVAAYDTFGSSVTGTGLNVSGQFSVRTAAAVGVDSGPTLPTSGMEAGDQFYNTTDERLYTYTGTVWKAAGIQTGPTNPASGTNGDLFANTTDGKLYRYFSGAWTAAVASTDVQGTLVAAQIAANAITATKILDGAVTGTKILDNAVSAGKIADGAVTGLKLADLAITTGKLVDSAITAVKIGNSAVTAAKTSLAAINSTTGNLNANTVTATNIVAGTITALQLAAGTITANEIAAGTITTAKIAAGAITATEIAAGAITGTSFAANSINGDRIVAGSITASLIAAGTITATQIAANTITGDRIVAGGITATHIAAGAITGDSFAANSISGTKITAGTLDGDKIIANSITAAEIATGTITASEIAASTITGGKIAAATIDGANIKGATITGGNIVGNTITADKLNVINLNAISSVLGTVTIDNGVGNGYIRTSGKTGADETTGFYAGKTGSAMTFEVCSGNDLITFKNSGAGSQIRFGPAGTPTFHVDSAGNMTINKANVIGTLQLKNNSVTVPAAIAGSGGLTNITPGAMRKHPSASITVNYPQAVKMQVLVTWQSATTTDSNTRCEVRIGGWSILAADDSNVKGYSLSHACASLVTLGAGTHTFDLYFGNTYSGGSWNLGAWSVTLLGVMK